MREIKISIDSQGQKKPGKLNSAQFVVDPCHFASFKMPSIQDVSSENSNLMSSSSYWLCTGNKIMTGILI